MKKSIITISASLALLASCTQDTPTWVTTCPHSDIYGTHQFRIIDLHPDADGNFTRQCIRCGLQYKFIEGAKCPSRPGAVELYRNPQTGKFDTYIITYRDDDNNEVHVPVDASAIIRK